MFHNRDKDKKGITPGYLQPGDYFAVHDSRVAGMSRLFRLTKAMEIQALWDECDDGYWYPHKDPLVNVWQMEVTRMIFPSKIRKYLERLHER